MKVNTFLIGVQKAGTTSLYDWIMQHPDVEGNFGLKDIPVFVNPEFIFDEEWLSNQYETESKIKIHGSVQYFFYAERFIKRIEKYIKQGAKFILVLRNPIDRALSGYSYGKKINMIDPDIDLDHEIRFNLEAELEILSSQYSFFEKGRLTPISHGMYSASLKLFLDHIPSKNFKILIYEELFAKKEKGIKDIYSFLDIDNRFVPNFKKINVSGVQRIKNINIIWKNSIFQYLLKPLIPYQIRQKVVKFINEKNTKPVKLELTEKEKEYLWSNFWQDIKETEKLLGRDLDVWTNEHSN